MSENKSNSNLLAELLVAEDLEYNLPSAASIVTEKSSKVFFFDKNSYSDTSDRMIITLNTGADFINGRNSYLTFNLKVPSTATSLHFGSGSAANIFREILITSRDGSEIERIRDLNVLTALKARWMNAQDSINNIHSQSGYNADQDVTGYTPVEWTPLIKAGYDFVIPMRDLSALFDCDKLLPSFLMSGLRLQFVFEKPETAILGDDQPVTAYTVSNPVMRLETIKLSDSVMNQLTQNAANSGLVIPIDTYDLTRDTTSGTNQVNIEVRRNVSQVLGVIVKSRLTDEIANATKDSMGSETFTVASYRFRLGSQFVPSSSVDKQTEMYSLAQIAFNKFHQTAAENCVSLRSYLGGAGVPYKLGLVATDLERSAVDLSGVSISNSKVLAYEATMNGDSDRTHNIWIQFTRALTIYLTSVLVED